jgi:hypothetical protein
MRQATSAVQTLEPSTTVSRVRLTGGPRMKSSVRCAAALSKGSTYSSWLATSVALLLPTIFLSTIFQEDSPHRACADRCAPGHERSTQIHRRLRSTGCRWWSTSLMLDVTGPWTGSAEGSRHPLAASSCGLCSVSPSRRCRASCDLYRISSTSWRA